MKRFLRGFQSFGALLVLCAGLTGAARAVDLSQAVILVASERLAGSPFEQTVILAAPLPQGGHVGFVVNRPTSVKLEALFPEQASTHNVVEPVYAGGPVLSRAVFAVTRKAPDSSGAVLSLMPGLVLVIDGEAVDRIIEATPNDARYFVGLMIWAPDELDEQIDQGAWDVRSADMDIVLPASASGLWKALSGIMV
jgi:putative transcriptional regulator